MSDIPLPDTFCNQIFTTQCIHDLLHNETLLASVISAIPALLGVIAATITIIVMLLQMGQAERHKKEDLALRHQAEKAMFTMTLQDLILYFKDHTIGLKQKIQINDEKYPTIRLDVKHKFQDFPENAMQNIKDLLATTKSKYDIEIITKFVKSLQIYKSDIDNELQNCLLKNQTSANQNYYAVLFYKLSIITAQAFNLLEWSKNKSEHINKINNNHIHKVYDEFILNGYIELENLQKNIEQHGYLEALNTPPPPRS